MKKRVMSIFAIALVGGLTLTSCGGETNEGENTESQEVAELYTCPMSECEDGKTYEEKGTCPVCGMDLMLKE